MLDIAAKQKGRACKGDKEQFCHGRPVAAEVSGAVRELLAVIVAIGVVVLSLYRQIGVLHERTAPVGGLLTESLAVNQLTEMQLQRMDGVPWD